MTHRGLLFLLPPSFWYGVFALLWSMRAKTQEPPADGDKPPASAYPSESGDRPVEASNRFYRV